MWSSCRMPSPLIHIACGLAIGRAAGRNVEAFPACPRPSCGGARAARGLPIVAAVAASLLPDADFVPGLVYGNARAWHNQASHSLFVAAGFALAFGLVARASRRENFGRAAALALAAYGLHLLLDVMTVGRGERILWPFSAARFQTPFLLFRGARWDHGLWSVEHLKTLANEAAVLAAAAGGWWAWRILRRAARPADAPAVGACAPRRPAPDSRP